MFQGHQLLPFRLPKRYLECSCCSSKVTLAMNSLNIINLYLELETKRSGNWIEPPSFQSHGEIENVAETTLLVNNIQNLTAVCTYWFFTNSGFIKKMFECIPTYTSWHVLSDYNSNLSRYIISTYYICKNLIIRYIFHLFQYPLFI